LINVSAAWAFETSAFAPEIKQLASKVTSSESEIATIVARRAISRMRQSVDGPPRSKKSMSTKIASGAWATMSCPSASSLVATTSIPPARKTEVKNGTKSFCGSIKYARIS